VAKQAILKKNQKGGKKDWGEKKNEAVSDRGENGETGVSAAGESDQRKRLSENPRELKSQR